MKIDIRNEDVLYLEINGWNYYIDDSTNEQIIDKWKDIQCTHCDSRLTLHHMDWSAIICSYCEKEIQA